MTSTLAGGNFMRHHAAVQRHPDLRRQLRGGPQRPHCPRRTAGDASGALTFMGGVDDKPTSRWESVKTAKNYVRAALDDMAAGNPVAEAVTRPYGCSVKSGS